MDYRTSNEGILILKWFDNKEVCVGSNHYSAEPVSTVRCWDKKDKAYVTLTRPAVIGAYNKGMGAVDRYNYLCYAFSRAVDQHSFFADLHSFFEDPNFFFAEPYSFFADRH